MHTLPRVRDVAHPKSALVNHRIPPRQIYKCPHARLSLLRSHNRTQNSFCIPMHSLRGPFPSRLYQVYPPRRNSVKLLTLRGLLCSNDLSLVEGAWISLRRSSSRRLPSIVGGQPTAAHPPSLLVSFPYSRHPPSSHLHRHPLAHRHRGLLPTVLGLPPPFLPPHLP